MTLTVRHSLLALGGLLASAAFAPAQIKEPPRAEKVDVQIRFRIRADRDERVRQYRALEKHLASLGFVDARRDEEDRDLDELDPNAERHVGTIPGAKVLDILNDARVQSILFAPAGFAYPDSGDKPVAIRIGLRGGMLGPVQQLLHKQIVDHLAKLGFSEALGYDTRGYTIVRGSIPYKSLDLLVKDVRGEPSGWFLAETPPDKLPAPLRERSPIRWTEVLPITEFQQPFAPPPTLPAQLKYSADLRAALLDPAVRDAPLRVEVLLQTRIESLEALRTLIHGRYPDASLDGVIGNVASIRLPRAAMAEGIANEPTVLGVRLPRQGHETIVATVGGGGKVLTPAEALKAARLDELHALGYTGARRKVILIGTDFTGAERDLPKRTRLIDLTTELTPDLVPAKPDPARLGLGTAAARALAAVAPDSELILVRIDPGCFFHLYAILRLARGDRDYTDALQVRIVELALRSAALDREKKIAIDAYRAAFADQGGEAKKGDEKFDRNDPNSPQGIAAKRRQDAKAALDAIFAREKELGVQINKLNAYQKELSVLLGADVIVNTLVWESGYPLDGLNDFAGTVEKLTAPLPPRVNRPLPPPKKPLVWVQAASNAGSAVWSGPIRDTNSDGLLEFVPFAAKLPAEHWTPQMNFLGMRTSAGETAPEIAKDAKLRFVVQWREPGDPNFPGTEIPAYPIALRLFRQIDPAGTQRASDEMEEVARSPSVPNVIFRTPTYLVYEQMVEYTVPAAGRFALVLESAPTTAPLLSALKRDIEVVPRLVVETVGAAPNDPRAVFRSFTNFTAGVGTPGDALGAITVGTGAPGAQVTGGTGIQLRLKPDLIGPEALAFGPQTYGGEGISTAFAGGAAVVLVQTGATGPNVFLRSGIEPGKKLELPVPWIRAVREMQPRRP
jgi:hypothetical protein